MTTTPLATTLAASSGTASYIPIWILLAIFVPLCTLIGVVVWN